MPLKALDVRPFHPSVNSIHSSSLTFYLTSLLMPFHGPPPVSSFYHVEEFTIGCTGD